MKLLVTGANGQVGWELAQAGSQVIALTQSQLNIAHADDIAKKIVEFSPDILINAAAYTAVDKAEQEREHALSINSDGPRFLAQACAQHNIPLIHLSTDYIFSGEQKKPYREEDKAAPLNFYGESKWLGEQAVRECWDKHIILRLSGVFSSHGHNFVKTILRLAKEKEELRVVADQTTCPTSAGSIAKTILLICQKIIGQSAASWGTYNYCSSEPTSWYQFAETIVQMAHPHHSLMVKSIVAIPSSEYPTPAKRPHYSVLNCDKLKKEFGIEQGSWREDLGEVIKNL